jgi:hypothetical protein
MLLLTLIPLPPMNASFPAREKGIDLKSKASDGLCVLIAALDGESLIALFLFY